MIGESVLRFLREAAGLFVEMAPYLLIGFTVAGALHVFVKKDWVLRHVGSSGVSSAVKASAFGVPLPLCSCAVVPAAMYLNRAGASKPAVMSFLISTPQTGVDSIIATYGLMGPLFAVVRPVAALLTGIAGGSALAGLQRRWAQKESPAEGAEPAGAAWGGKGAETTETAPDIRDSTETENAPGPRGGETSLRGRLSEFARYAYVESVDAIAVQFLFGLGVAALLTLLLPPDFFVGSSLGTGLPAMLLMIVVGIPMYICATSSIPIAVALLAKGLDPGAAYVFLMAGPATNAATLAILSKALGKRETLLFLATVIAGGLVFGGAINILAEAFSWTPPVLGQGATLVEEQLGPWAYILALFFAFLIAGALRRKLAARRDAKQAAAEARQYGPSFEVLPVQGMTCDCCANAVESALRGLEGIQEVRVDVHGNRVHYRGKSSRSEVATAVKAAGYEPGE